MQEKKRGRPATGRTTSQVRVPKYLEIPVRKYMKTLQTEYLEPMPTKVSAYLVHCLLEKVSPSLSVLKEELKDWVSSNVALIGIKPYPSGDKDFLWFRNCE